MGGNKSNQKTIKMREELYISVQIYRFFLNGYGIFWWRGGCLLLLLLKEKLERDDIDLGVGERGPRVFFSPGRNARISTFDRRSDGREEAMRCDISADEMEN